MGPRHPCTRRILLRSGALAAVAALAGCGHRVTAPAAAPALLLSVDPTAAAVPGLISAYNGAQRAVRLTSAPPGGGEGAGPGS